MKKSSRIWSQEVTRREESLVTLRRDFHRHPELSFQEHRTAQIVAERLRAAKLEVHTGIGGTGVVGIFRGKNPGRTVAWRADMDALPLTETLNVPFASQSPGVMHACGHDGHTAIAITLAEVMAAGRDEIPGTAVFIFQPAEEIGAGAKAIIEGGVLDNPPVDAVYGLHLVTRLPAGHVAVRPGPFMASADAFVVKVQGRGGHGALPHQAIDPISVAANILLGMQNLISREVSAKEPAVLTVGQVLAGTKHNIIPATAEMYGTLRTLNPAVRERVKERLGLFVGHIARAYQAEANLSFHEESIPSVVNDTQETALVEKCTAEELGHEAVGDADFTMASDDMSRFLVERPGCYFLAGIGPASGPSRPHHAPEFEMNEDGLSVALRVGLKVVLNGLRGKGN